MSLQGFIHLWVPWFSLRNVCSFRSFLPNIDEKSRLRISDNTEAKGIESEESRNLCFLNICH